MVPGQIRVDPAQVAAIAVGICRTGYGNMHTGVVYKNDAGVWFFHQAMHFHTVKQAIAEAVADLAGPFCCVVPAAVELERAKAVAGFWDFIAARGEPIAYALQDDPHATFDENTGKLVLPNGRGLSCATFVLVLFRAARLTLVDTTAWPTDRAGDKTAQEMIVKILDGYCKDRNHVEEVRKEIGCERVRPEEVAGSALYEKNPVRHREAEDAGHFILGNIHMLSHFYNGRAGQGL